MTDWVVREVASCEAGMIALRRDLHAHPELSFHETKTAELIAGRLRASGVDVQTGVAGNGVVATLRGAHPGKTIALRADIDALPISEVSALPYRSRNKGVMHA